MYDTAMGVVAHRQTLRTLAVTLVLAISGCSSSRAILSRGERAEVDKDYRKAYQVYSAAARRDPGSGSVEDALKRVTPLASQYWIDAGRQFERSDQYDMAWRCYMRSLYIYPANDRALAAIRRLERDHPGRVAAPQLAYQHYGARSLQVGPVEVIQPVVAGTSPGGAPTLGTSRRVLDTPSSGIVSRPTKEPAKPREEPVSSPPRSESVATRTVEAAPAPPPRDEPKAPPSRRTALPEPAEPSSDFLRTVVASREDHRFPKTVALGDDIRMRLLDTDPDPDADVAIYRGKRQIHKIKNWRVGESVGITGRSGRGYEVQLISIFDATETVRVGIRLLPTTDS